MDCLELGCELHSVVRALAVRSKQIQLFQSHHVTLVFRASTHSKRTVRFDLLAFFKFSFFSLTCRDPSRPTISSSCRPASDMWPSRNTPRRISPSNQCSAAVPIRLLIFTQTHLHVVVGNRRETVGKKKMTRTWRRISEWRRFLVKKWEKKWREPFYFLFFMVPYHKRNFWYILINIHILQEIKYIKELHFPGRAKPFNCK